MRVMSSSLHRPDVPYLADRDDQIRTTSQLATTSMPVHVAAARPLADEPSTGLQFSLPPTTPLHQLHHVPSSSASCVNAVVADAYNNSSSSGSSTCGDLGCIGNGSCPLSLGVPLPAAPTRRMREFIPESKKDDEYWMKRQKNNEAAKRSREKRRANDAVMMRRIHELAVENKRLKLEVEVLRRQLGIGPPTTGGGGGTESKPLKHVTAAAPPDAPRLSEHQLIVRQKQEQQAQPLPSLLTRYDDATASLNAASTAAYRLSGAVERGEQKRSPDDTYHHHRHHHNYPAGSLGAVPSLAAVWPSSCCSVTVQFSTSSVDAPARTLAGVPTYRYSSSGNSLPSIGDLCAGGAAQLDNGAGGASSTYRSVTDARRMSCCRTSSLPQALVDSSAPIVIFSDVSSSGEEESVDESWFGRHVDTLTLRRSIQQKVAGAGARGVVESPLNLSAPSRHQSPGHATSQCGADGSGVMLRRSSIDLAQTSAPRLPVKTASESALQPVTGRHRADNLLHSRRPSWVSERSATHAAAAERLNASRNGVLDDDQQSSRSTSLSSLASVAWQAGVDVPPQQSVDDLYAGGAAAVCQATSSDIQLAAGDGLHVSCGLPLKVRRKLGSAATSRLSVDDAPRPQYNSVTLATTRQWTSSSNTDHGLSTDTPQAAFAVSTEWFPAEPAQRSA